VKVEIESQKGLIKTFVMIDSGCSENVIDSHFAEYLGVPLHPKTNPLHLSLADGTLNPSGIVKDELTTQLIIGKHHERITLDVTKIQSYPIMLGIPWLKLHDPWIHWSRHKITFSSPRCLASCLPEGIADSVTALQKYPFIENPVQLDQPLQTSETIETSKNSERSEHSEYSENPEHSDITETKESTDTTDPANTTETTGNLSHATKASSHTRSKTKSKKKARKSAPSRPASAPRSSLTPPKVAMVSGAAFGTYFRHSEIQIFQLTAQSLSEPESPELQDPDLSKIPPEYHEFAKVFSQEEADKLPEHRLYDHKIRLKDDTAPPWGPIYSLSPEELQALKEYIDINLQKGFIRHSQSPCAAPILFAKKPDGGLRLCVDYRGLNKLTIKNRYPLPLINELFDRVGGAKYYTKFDIRDGYHRLRIAKGEEWKTAFRTRYGLFEYQVMPFGLCNAPGTFQHYMNDVFHDYLDDFLANYLDDLLIYSKTLKEHKRHVRLVLQRLQDAGLYLKPSKCEFHTTSTKFLGYILSTDGISMDPAKVESVLSWPAPKSVLEIQMFLGLANFYRRFIKNFSRLLTPITSLLKKSNSPFNWTNAADKAFNSLKKAFTSAPILRHFDYSKPAVLETDASDYALGAVLSQLDDETGLLHPCAFHSRKFIPAELNYEIYDKEMLAIVDSVLTWRHYLEGSGHQTRIVTDHKNLLWFTETKVYNRRQTRWAEKLAYFDFTLEYRPGRLGGKPDALSRRPDYKSRKGGDEQRNPNEFQFLKDHQIKYFPAEEIPRTIAAIRRNNPTASQEFTDDSLLLDIQNAVAENLGLQSTLKKLQDPSLILPEEKEYLSQFKFKDDTLLKNGLIYIPDDNSIKLRILKAHHDSRLAGHLGQDKTYELISRNYTWPTLRKYINNYINTCDTCARNKVSRQSPHGKLHPLPIPPAPWKSVSMDYIVELPLSKGFNAIYVCVDRLTKMSHFIPTNSTVTAQETANLYLSNVCKLHGLPDDIVSDRGTQFTSNFSRHLLKLCKIQGNLSTAYHPQSDGQTERINSVLEQYLRIFCDYQQDNWVELLPMAEFTYNNAKHASTQVSPFYANYGFHPRLSIDVESPKRHQNPAADEWINHLHRVHRALPEALRSAQEQHKKYYDAHKKSPPHMKIGDLVWLNRKNIGSNRPSSKLDAKRLGPFKILDVVGASQLAFKLDLPHQLKIHPVFHVSLLQPYQANSIPGRIQAKPPPPAIIDGEEEYEVAQVLDSRIRNRKLEYLVDWKDYGPDDRTWELANTLKKANERVKAFRDRYPQRPSVKDIPTTSPRRSSASGRGRTVRN
jgi:RNase H-like domain found in reverse transcriptase/Reverse transcriptase (RNA-dependent DNA polymerase)/Integrase zinc binding domain/Chromo (CHRromatin Organisation MOdifier) domain